MAASTSIQVLSVTDTDQDRLILSKLLASFQGIALADEASNEIESLQKLKSKPMDVVLLDLSLRNLDSVRLTSIIRNSHPTVRVLISTAFRRAADIFAALDAGADGYVLKGNDEGLEVAIRSVRLGAVWLDPGIATQVLEVVESQASSDQPPMRILSTGLFPIPLFPHEKNLLNKVATSSCVDGVCMVDPDFVIKLRGYAPK